MKRVGWLICLALCLLAMPLAHAQIKADVTVDPDCDGFDMTISASELPANVLFEGIFTVTVDPTAVGGVGTPFDCDYPISVESNDEGVVPATTFRFDWCETPYGMYTVSGFVTAGGETLILDSQDLIDCPTCGNGQVDDGEQCDDGNDVDDDGCSNSCTLPEPFCGDGTVDEGEQCDDGNDVDDDDCRNDCTIPVCGDGITDEGEQCDDGNDVDDDDCRNDCTIPVCGDGITDEGEQCDDGNDVDDDDCRNDCTIPVCGDGITDEGEQCDDGNDVDDDDCRNDCTIPVCGDGITDEGEQCDDGNDVDDDDCRNDCTIPVCGDGITDEGEQCDDGNDVDDDDCRNDCTIPVCGDGITDEGEQCDDGNDVDDDGCSNSCTLPEPFCGDGTVDEGEQCDDGNDVDDDDCRNDCTIPVCGDGITDEGEQCDDGNDVDDDDCRNDCTIPVCGDGITDEGEQCDDGNDVDDDDCRNDCTIPVCGDGITDEGEQCDDGNDVDDDDCSNECMFVCTGRIGNFVWNDGVDGATGECDGIQPEDGSMGINGVEVSLYSEGHLIATTFTGEVMVMDELLAGYYQFTDLCAGTYEVVVSDPDDLIPAPVGVGDADTDSNVNPSIVVLESDDSVDMTIDFGYCAEQMGGDQGCTPGYWSNQSLAWEDTSLATDDTVVSLFANAAAWPELAERGLQDAMIGGPWSHDQVQREAEKLVRHGIAAVLNSEHPDVDYALDAQSLIDDVNDALATGDRHVMNALKDDLDAYNNAGCPLSADGGYGRGKGRSSELGGIHDKRMGRMNVRF